MKILFISYSYWPPDFGGELLIAIERLEHLTQRGFQVQVLTGGKPGFPRRENRNGISILRSPVVHTSRLGRALRRLLFTLWAWMAVLFWKYDVVHFGSLSGLGEGPDTFFGWLWAGVIRLRGKRSVWVHSLADSESQAVAFHGLSGRMRQAFWKQVSHLAAVSPSLYESLRKDFAQAVCLPNGIRDDIFMPLPEAQRQAFRRAQGVRDGEVVFTFLGTIGRRKGFDLLAEGFARLCSTHSEWRLWVVGPRTRAESQNLNEREVAEVCAPLANCEDQVTYWGRINDRRHLAHILASSDVFLFPTRREGMPLSPIEAMACGVPIVISRIPGVTDLANIEEVAGLYIPPGDRDALEQAMLRLGEDAILRRRMGEQAARRAREAFGWTAHIDRWERLYRSGKLE